MALSSWFRTYVLTASCWAGVRYGYAQANVVMVRPGSYERVSHALLVGVADVKGGQVAGVQNRLDLLLEFRRQVIRAVDPTDHREEPGVGIDQDARMLAGFDRADDLIAVRHR